MSNANTQLASDRIMTRKEVIAVTGRCAASLWRDCNAGRFPKPRQVGPKRIGFLESEVRSWMENLPVATKQDPSPTGVENGGKGGL